jgi:multidrug efflux pump subunit AcrA (membrane-fusion protein)
VLRFAEIPEQTFDGRIHRVTTVPTSQSSEAPVVHRAIVHFQNDKGLVKPGMVQAQMAVRTQNVENVLAVPVEAVQRDSAGNTVVRTLVDRKWVATRVEVGVSDGRWIEIRSGLEENELVQVPK